MTRSRYPITWTNPHDLERYRTQAENAMDCLRKLADGLPEPWSEVARCGYIGCGGENHWRGADQPNEKSP